jgi:hypothetical protein
MTPPFATESAPELPASVEQPPAMRPTRGIVGRLNFGRLFSEFVVVFAGVALALLAEDWRDSRKTDAAAAEALRLILADLQSDSIQLAAVLEPLPAHDQAAEWLTRHWSDSGTPSDSIEPRLQSFIPAWQYQPQRTAFISLRDGAGIGIISSNELRQSLVRYFEQTQVEVEQWLAFHWAEREVLWEFLWPHVRMPPGQTAGSMLPSTDDPPRLLTRWPGLIAYPEGYNQFGQVGVSANLAVVALREALQENSRLREAIRQQLD